MMQSKTALLIGNSDGIGKKTTLKLLEQGYQVIGLSRSNLSIKNPRYQHHIHDVTSPIFREFLSEVLSTTNKLDLCIYFAGIGEEFNLNNLSVETKVLQVNLMSAAITTELALQRMLTQGNGHFIGISSVADQLISPEAPSYSASKAGVSRFWEGLGLALRNKGVRMSNIRFGFVDTKMGKSPIRPFLLSVDDAADFVLNVIKKPKVRATYPKSIIPLVWLASLPMRLRMLFN